MLNQGQFFDDEPYRTGPPPPKSGTERTDFPSPGSVQAAKDYLSTGSAPNTLEGRQARMLVNRTRILGAMDQVEMRMTDKTIPTAQAGIPKVDGFYHEENNWLPNRFREHEWRKFGRVEEVPFNRIGSAQGAVSQKRVNMLARLPGTGVDPRFAGAMRELPAMVKTLGGAYVVHQGNHRTVTDRVKHQPEMFTQARVVDAPYTRQDHFNATEAMHEYRMDRAIRTGDDTRIIAEHDRQNPEAPIHSAWSQPIHIGVRDPSNSFRNAWQQGQRGPAVLRDSDQFESRHPDSVQ